MRSTLAKIIKKNEYLLHADMFNIKNFPTQGQVINCGLGESNLLNIAGGLASLGKTVYVYGVSGFIIHRFEQLKFSCKHFGAKKGKIILCNAGKVGYEKLGIGHLLNDDLQLMEILEVPTFQPESINDFRNAIKVIKKFSAGLFYIQLGKDFES